MREYQPGNDRDMDSGLTQWTRVADIPNFPVDSFEELQRVIAEKKYRLGVDAVTAARWSDQLAGSRKKLLIKLLSLLLIFAGAASVVTALWTHNYWLLMALPIMGVSFYISHPSSRIAKWVTIGGAVSVVVFFNLLLNDLVNEATLAAYAGLTFAAVRAAAFINNASFRNALTSDEALFVMAYENGACSLRKGGDGVVYAHRIAIKD